MQRILREISLLPAVLVLWSFVNEFSLKLDQISLLSLINYNIFSFLIECPPITLRKDVDRRYNFNMVISKCTLKLFKTASKKCKVMRHSTKAFTYSLCDQISTHLSSAKGSFIYHVVSEGEGGSRNDHD